MEITIGVQNVPRELVVETDATADAIAKDVRKALDSGAPLDITDNRGRRYLVPAAMVGYVEIGAETRKVGFHSV